MKTNAMADLIGPQFGAPAVADRLGYDTSDLDSLVNEGALLGMRTSDGVWVYPAFQFAGAGAVRPALLPVLRRFAGANGWTVAVWLRTPHEHLDGATPETWLATGRDPAPVIRLAGHWAGELAR